MSFVLACADVRPHLSPLTGTKRVHNNIIYNEYIGDREHVHMNSTQWETLTDFTKWLGREGMMTLTLSTHTHVGKGPDQLNALR